MSRVDELIAELAPQGVAFKTLGDVAEVTAGATPSKSVAEYWTNGTIPWLSSGEVNKGTIYEADTLISQAGYDSCSTKLIPSGAVVMALAGQGKTRGTVARTRLACCTNQSLASIVPKGGLNSDFLYHFLRTQYSRLRDVSSGDGTRGGLNLAMIRSYRVPVPPVEVQREIVRILDQFTQLEAELEAELEARTRQYKYYRHELLGLASNHPRAAIAELIHGVSSGRNKSRVEGGAYPVYGSTGRIGSTDQPKYSNDALLIARVGANAGRVNAVSGAYDVSDNTLIVSPTERWDIRFAFHQLTHMHLNQYAVGGGQPLVTGRLVKGLEVVVPPLDEQKRIASILDQFDDLMNDLSVGLPAELAARRRQYEYYRDRLLTFKESPA